MEHPPKRGPIRTNLIRRARLAAGPSGGGRAPIPNFAMRTTTLSLLALALLPACAATTPSAPQAYAEASRQRIAILLGQRSLDEDDFAPVENQGLFGIEFSDGGPTDGVGFEAGLTGSSDSDDAFLPGVGTVDVESSVGELYVGVRKEFQGSGVRPYVGAGVSMSQVEINVGPASEDDNAFGLYLHGGLLLPFNDRFALLLDARARFGEDYRIAGVDGNADFFALALGFAFGL